MKNADTEDDLIPHSDLTDPPDPPGEERRTRGILQCGSSDPVAHPKRRVIS